MPDIDENIWKKYKNQDVLVFGLHPGDSPSQVADFIKQTGVTFPILRDETGTLGSLDFPQGVGYPYPRDVIVGKDSTIRAIRNSFNVEETDALVQQLLKE